MQKPCRFRHKLEQPDRAAASRLRTEAEKVRPISCAMQLIRSPPVAPPRPSAIATTRARKAGATLRLQASGVMDLFFDANCFRHQGAGMFPNADSAFRAPSPHSAGGARSSQESRPSGRKLQGSVDVGDRLCLRAPPVPHGGARNFPRPRPFISARSLASRMSSGREPRHPCPEAGLALPTCNRRPIGICLLSRQGRKTSSQELRPQSPVTPLQLGRCSPYQHLTGLTPSIACYASRA